MTTDQVTDAATQLRETIAVGLADLADVIMGRPDLGSPEWFAERAQPAAIRAATRRDWHLVKISISVTAGVDPVGDIVNARLYGASWQQLGTALGTSKQAAHERWSTTCDRSATRFEFETDILAVADHDRAMADVKDNR